MPSILPILVGGPRPAPKPTARQLERAKKKAAHAAEGHAAVAAQHRQALAAGVTDPAERESLERQAKAHEDARDGYQRQVDQADADLKAAKR